jgi:hypothetical protein
VPDAPSTPTRRAIRRLPMPSKRTLALP